MYIPTNEFQTPITEELLQMYPEEVLELFLDCVLNIPFVKWLISPDRPRAKDLPRDNEGRIIVDLAKPHIIEDADYFRLSALHFLKYGCYTFLKPNSNPHSEYKKFWREEIRRCREGYVRESDGEWVTGFCYYFLNYLPMMINKLVSERKALRKQEFGLLFEGIYWRFHYLWQARENGKHAIELAKRGAGKSYSLAAIMGHNLELGENEEAHERIITVLTAYQKEYLSDSKDGTLSKFKPAINFVWANTPFPRLTLKNSPNDMTWLMGYKDEYGIERGSLNLVLAVSSKDDSEKLRGKRGWILFEEMGSFKGLLSLYDITRKSVEDGDVAFACMYLVGCVCAGTKVWTPDGRNVNIEDLQREDGIIGFAPNDTVQVDNSTIHLQRGITKEPILSSIEPINKPCVRITLNNSNVLECSIDHPIFIQKHICNHDGSINYYEEVFRKAGDLLVGDRVIECREVSVFGNNTLFDARLVGMLIGDGTYGLRNSVKYCSEDGELLDYVKSSYTWHKYGLHTTKKGNLYEEGRIVNLVPKLREIGIYGQTRINKRLPINYQTLSKEDTILLLSGLYDTDGSICLTEKDGFIYLTQSNREILELVKLLWRKFGVIGAITKTLPKLGVGRKDRNPWYTLTISGRYSAYNAAKTLKLLVGHKRINCLRILEFYDSHPSKKPLKYPKDIIVSTVKAIEYIGDKPVYNMTTGLSHTYLSNNIVTHNTAAEDESDFSSAKTLLYSPDGYNILSIDNVWDKPKQGKPKFGFFFPSYINRFGCFNKDGVSDVVKALLQILMARYTSKYNSVDPKSVLRVIAEDPITPAEAIVKVKSAYYPVLALNERLLLLDSNPLAYADVWVGDLVYNSKNLVEFRPTADEPIRKFGVANDTPGAIEIYEMPERDSTGTVFPNRYILGHDPVDNDTAESSSLSSTFVFDLYTDRIVAEFTGRKQFADDNFEIVRKLCLFYNGRCLFEAHAYSELVPTPIGFRRWEDVKIGDTLFSPTKGTVKVIDIPVDTEMPIYKVTLVDGRVVTASDRHIWPVYYRNEKTIRECTTEQLMKYKLKNKYGQHTIFIPEGNGVEYDRLDLPIDPYTMGLILSEGSIRGSHCTKNNILISSSKEDMLVYEREIPYPIKHIGTKGFSWHINIPNCKAIMKRLGLYGSSSHTKFIPKEYLVSHTVLRMNLLLGIMDGDGFAGKKGASILITMSLLLANDVMSLSRSLGIKAWILNKDNGIYRVCLASKFKIFKLPRKVVELHIYKPYSKGSKASAILNKTAIEKIEFSHYEKGKCVTVDSLDGLYYVNDYVVTHNSNKKGLYSYMAKYNSTHLLAETPDYLREKQLVKYSSFGSNKYGVNASAAINNYANDLIRLWLLKPTIVMMKDEEGVDTPTEIPNMMLVKNRALLEELVAFTPEINVDRIRALGMVMLYREAQIILYLDNLNKEAAEKIAADYLGLDDYFSRNYDRRGSKVREFNKVNVN